MRHSANPLLPATYDVFWTVAIALVAALAVVALVSIGRHARRLGSAQALGWTLVVIVVPVLGPLAWLSIGRISSRNAVDASAGGSRSLTGY